MDENPNSWTRRQFLTRLGLVGGAAPLYHAMGALGLSAIPGAHAAPTLPAGSGKGKRVVIVGAGIAGLTSAYELGKAGYQCTILEATNHIGGRNRTARRGDKLIEVDSVQTCEFDDDPNLYFNCGPARLSYHHTEIMKYCRQFEVQLEPYVNDNRNAFLHSSTAYGGKPQRAQDVLTDQRGYISELLAKAINKNALDQPLTSEDRDRMLGMLKSFGDLDKDFGYKGSTRAGFIDDGILGAGHAKPPMPLADLLKSDFWYFKTQFSYLWDQSPSMMQPTGGMDMVVKGFLRNIKARIIRNAPVVGIVNGEKDVRVRYKDPSGKGEQEIVADYCINNAPGFLMAGIDHNFSPDYVSALKAIKPGSLFKIAFQAKRRFWEEDYQIYGGISWTDQDILQIWYPPHGINRKKGIVIGAYIFGLGPSPDGVDIGDKWSRMKLGERLKNAIIAGEKIHPGYGQMMEKGLSVAWNKVPHMFGCAFDWEEEDRKTHYVRLQKPEKRHYMVGDQMSYLPGWQEGAIRSAHAVIEDIHKRTTAA